MMRVIAGAGFALAMAGGAFAQAGSLSGDGLRQTIAGRTIVLSTPVGGIPITYRPDGTLTGKVNAMQAAVGAGPRQDTGRWWISSNRICQQWKAWLDGQQYCYEMRVAGETVHWKRNDGRTGTAKILTN